VALLAVVGMAKTEFIQTALNLLVAVEAVLVDY
jgi:hypothetical protein